MPQTLPDGVVVGMLKSPWASNQAIARREAGKRRFRPAIAPACEVQSPPTMSSRGGALVASFPPSARWTWMTRRGM